MQSLPHVWGFQYTRNKQHHKRPRINRCNSGRVELLVVVRKVAAAVIVIVAEVVLVVASVVSIVCVTLVVSLDPSQPSLAMCYRRGTRQTVMCSTHGADHSGAPNTCSLLPAPHRHWDQYACKFLRGSWGGSPCF